MNKTINKKTAIIISFGIALIVFAILFFFQVSIMDKQKQIKRTEIAEKYIYFQKDISNIIYSNINLLNGYVAFLSTQKNFSKENADIFLNELLKDKMEYIRNVTVIEDTTIVASYPSKGNEASIGIDLAKIDAQKEKILKVKNSLKPIFQGPVSLVQGGTGFIIRIPVEKQGKYWGQVSVVIDADRFKNIIKSYEKELNIDVLIINVDGEKKTQIYGNKYLKNINYSKFDYNADLLNWIIYIDAKYTKPDRLYSNIMLSIFIVLLSIAAGIFSWVYQKSSAKTRYQADYDQLTGLHNRNYLIRYVPSLLQDAKKNNFKLGVIILDINMFKCINDNYGHNVGDIVLKDFSTKLKAVSINEDIVFRIGGDEFMILCSKIKNEESLKILKDKIKESMDYTIVINDSRINISTSVGYSIFPDDGDNVDAIMNIADKNMYKDKQSFYSTL